MTDNRTTSKHWTTLSASHVDAALRAQNPLHRNTAPAHGEFEAQADPLKAEDRTAQNFSEAGRRRMAERHLSVAEFKAMRGGSGMVKRQRIRPTLKPSPKLAYGVTAASFDQEWAREQRAARHVLGNAAPLPRADFLKLRGVQQSPKAQRDTTTDKSRHGPISREDFERARAPKQPQSKAQKHVKTFQRMTRRR